jgi:hypothetical protein
VTPSRVRWGYSLQGVGLWVYFLQMKLNANKGNNNDSEEKKNKTKN